METTAKLDFGTLAISLRNDKTALMDAQIDVENKKEAHRISFWKLRDCVFEEFRKVPEGSFQYLEEEHVSSKSEKHHGKRVLEAFIDAIVSMTEYPTLESQEFQTGDLLPRDLEMFGEIFASETVKTALQDMLDVLELSIGMIPKEKVAVFSVVRVPKK